MDFINIINKYNYPEDFIPFLKKVYDGLIDYFGYDKEPIIYEIFLNTKFVFNRSIKTTLKNEDMYEENSIVSIDELNVANGVFESYPIIKYQNNQFEITEIKRIIIISKFSLDLDYTIASFIHELGHLIKSYNGYTITDNILTKRTGFLEQSYKLEFINGKVLKTLIDTRNSGLEEGLNVLFEEEFMKKYFNPDYESKVYTGVKIVAEILCNNFNLKELFINAQISKDDSELINYFGTDNYQKLLSLSEKIYYYDLEKYKAYFGLDINKMKEYSSIIKSLINNEFKELYENIKLKNSREV